MKTKDQIIAERTKDLKLAMLCIKELKESKREMIAFYQAEIKVLQDKIKELMSNMKGESHAAD